MEEALVFQFMDIYACADNFSYSVQFNQTSIFSAWILGANAMHVTLDQLNNVLYRIIILSYNTCYMKVRIEENILSINLNEVLLLHVKILFTHSIHCVSPSKLL